MSNKGLKTGILVVFLANIINLSLSMVKSFILPKYLPIDTYAGIKTYQLYISYAGLAALGYIDGMYLKYGGENIDEIDRESFCSNISTFRILELLVSIIIAISGIILRDFIIVLVGATIISLNITDYYKCFFQATGEFKFYSRIMNISSVLMFTANMVILFLVRSDKYFVYIISYVIIYYLVWISLEIYTIKKNPVKIKYCKFSVSELKASISSGFFLMCGLLLSNFMTGLDRWFIKFTMDNYVFALYSFAASVEGFLSYAVSPVSITLYNYFCRNKNKTEILTIKQYIILFSCLIVSSAFPIRFILEYYIPKYYECVSVLFILFGGQAIYAIIRCFYINKYKSDNRQRKYFNNIIIVVVCGVILNTVLYLLMRRMEAYAIGTFISAVVWLGLCNHDYSDYKLLIKEILFIIICITAMLVYGMKLPSYIGLIFYLGTYIIAGLILMKNSMIEITRIAFKMIIIKSKKLFRRFSDVNF